MKSNFNTLFNAMLPRLMSSDDIDIEKELDTLVPLIIYEEKVTKTDLKRSDIRSRLTSALNANGIYSFEKSHFIYIENANEAQLEHFMEKAERDIRAAEARKSKAEMMKSQISMAWDEEGHFIGLHIPKAVNG